MTPDSLDSNTGRQRRFSCPSTLTTAPTTRSKSKMGKGSDWTVSQKLTLLNILKDASVDGRLQNAAPHPGMWPMLVAEFNAITGMSKTIAQVQEKLWRMKKLWKRFHQLLHHETGFGWDPDTNTVSRTVAQREAYLVVHKNAKQFRKKGLANYNLMTELFAPATATGLLHQSSRGSPPDIDQENDFKEQLNGLGIEESHDPTTPPPSAARPPSPTHTNFGKRATDSMLSIHLRSKCSKGKSQADTNTTALLKFVGAQDRRNEIFEKWIAIQNKALNSVAGSSHVGPESEVDSYSKCILLLQSMDGEDETMIFLKGCKELENGFAQKAFLVMSKAQRKAWLYSL